jgi:iron complex transport system substrate-binding protein
MGVFAALPLLLLLACSAVAEEPLSVEIKVSDDTAVEVSLMGPAERIVSLSPNLTEVLFHLGVGDKIVGVDEYSMYPQAAQDIPRVNNHAAANFELILALKPDLVVAWQSGNGMQMISRLRELGLTVFAVETEKIDAIPPLYRRLGELLGIPVKAEALAREFSGQINALSETYRGRQPVTVFYQIWSDPLMTLNGQHLVSDVIRLCGGRNIFHDAVPIAPSVGIEGVIAADPEVIVSSGKLADLDRWHSQWLRWSGISAVANRHLYLVPPDLMQRQSPRLLEGVEYLCDYLQNARASATTEVSR